MAKESYMCRYHKTQCYKWCQTCLDEYEQLPDVATMTPQERAYEVCIWIYEKKQVTMPFNNWLARLDKLVGRPVFSIEMVEAKERLVQEALGTRPHIQFVDEIIELLPERLRGNVEIKYLDDDGTREFSSN